MNQQMPPVSKSRMASNSQRTPKECSRSEFMSNAPFWLFAYFFKASGRKIDRSFICEPRCTAVGRSFWLGQKLEVAQALTPRELLRAWLGAKGRIQCLK